MRMHYAYTSIYIYIYIYIYEIFKAIKQAYMHVTGLKIIFEETSKWQA